MKRIRPIAPGAAHNAAHLCKVRDKVKSDLLIVLVTHHCLQELAAPAAEAMRVPFIGLNAQATLPQLLLQVQGVAPVVGIIGSQIHKVATTLAIEQRQDFCILTRLGRQLLGQLRVAGEAAVH